MELSGKEVPRAEGECRIGNGIFFSFKAYEKTSRSEMSFVFFQHLQAGRCSARGQRWINEAGRRPLLKVCVWESECLEHTDADHRMSIHSHMTSQFKNASINTFYNNNNNAGG